MASTSNKRISMKLKHPNPLFEQWLSEWRDKAIETDSKMQHCFGKALQSLRKYPLPLDSARDCRILQGFGEKLCQMLEKKLLEYKSKNRGVITADKDISDDDNNGESKIKTKKNRNLNLHNNAKVKDYVPGWRSGAYAILVTLYQKSLEPQYPGYMLKVDIIRHGQHFCDKSFVKPDPGSYYTAWSSMKTLLDKNLVTKQNSPAKFSLTDEGLVVAHKLFKNTLNNNSNDTLRNLTDNTHNLKANSNKKSKTSIILKRNDTGSKSDTSSQGSSAPSLNAKQIMSLETENQTDTESTCSSNVSQEETFILTPHSFDIILLVDKQETAGSARNPMDDSTLAELTHLNILYEVRHLKVGDYTWICRHHTTSKELVLPYIVERKRMDDFGGSIKDGRFHEQKFRLKQCGIQNLVYLIESYGSNTHTGLPITTLYQAAANTLLQDGFNVKFTSDIRGTTEYLASFTTVLKNIFENKTLVSCPKQNLAHSTVQDDLIPLMTFPEFNKGASKSRDFKVRELFIRHLLQLKGMSVDKALAIVEKYPTPLVLCSAYNDNPESGDKLLSTVTFGKLNKKIGPIISRAVHQLYTKQKF